MASQPIILDYRSPREKEILEWARKNVVPKIKPIFDAFTHEFIGPVAQTYPLPGPVEAFRAWCLTHGILKKFWQTM